MASTPNIAQEMRFHIGNEHDILQWRYHSQTFITDIWNIYILLHAYGTWHLRNLARHIIPDSLPFCQYHEIRIPTHKNWRHILWQISNTNMYVHILKDLRYRLNFMFMFTYFIASSSWPVAEAWQFFIAHMCKISWWWIHFHVNESRMKFPSNLNHDGKIVWERGPWSYSRKQCISYPAIDLVFREKSKSSTLRVKWDDFLKL